MVHDKLINLRKEKGLSQEELAAKVAMDQTTYSRKERGKSIITSAEWERIAKAMEVPLDEIKSEHGVSMKNESCVFNDNSVGMQYVNIPQEILDTLLRYNKKLEEEVTQLKK